MSDILFLQRHRALIETSDTYLTPATVIKMVDDLIAYKGSGLVDFDYQATIIYAGWINQPEHLERLIRSLPITFKIHLNGLSHFFSLCSNETIIERIHICVQPSQAENKLLLRMLFREANDFIILFFISNQILPIIDYYDDIVSMANKADVSDELTFHILSLPIIIITAFKLGRANRDGKEIQKLLLTHPELF